MSFVDLAWRFAGAFGALVVVGAAAAGIAYWLFRQLAKAWIKAQFDRELADFNAKKNQELARLQAEISRLADRATKFHEKEYEVLPEAWGLLNKAHSAVSAAIVAFQSFPDLNRMSEQAFEEFLEKSDLAESQKSDLRSSRDRIGDYSRINQWKILNDAHNAQAAFQNYIILNGVFIETGIADKMTEAAALLRSVAVSRRIGMQHGAHDLEMKALEEFKGAEPLVAEIKALVKSRLWAIQLPEAGPPN